MSDEARVALAFAGLHPERTRQLVERYRGPAGAVRAISAGRVDMPERSREAVDVGVDVRRQELTARGFSLTLRDGPGYPEHLSAWPDAPDVLFVRGTLPQRPGVAVVGTRRCTAYGRAVAVAYGEAIAGLGVPLISGLARGIDGAAHRGTTAESGVGVAVLGCGLDVEYPREHRWLADGLVEAGGAVVTEYPPGTPPEGWRFPPRNR